MMPDNIAHAVQFACVGARFGNIRWGPKLLAISGSAVHVLQEIHP